jgi:hypothetical protein
MRLAACALPAAVLVTLLAGCAPTVEDGARQVYAVSQICDFTAVQVRERSDLRPSSVLQGVTPPPGVDLDSVGSAYELSGCGKKQIFVCGRPFVGKGTDPFSVVDESTPGQWGDVTFHTEYYALTRATHIADGRVPTAVVCQPAAATVQ